MYAHHHPQQQQQQQQEQQQSRHQAPMWEESYAQGEVEGRMSPPASGTAVRRQSDTLQRVRRSSSTAQNPAEVEALLWNLGTPSSAAETADAIALSPRSSFAAPPSTAASLAQPAPAPAPSCTAAGPAPLIPVVDPGRQQSASASDAPPPKTARARQPRDDAGQAGLADKSCKQCRIRKVRCSRTWPVCGRCTIKELPCHYGNLVPIDLVKTMQPEARVAELEARIKSLEVELAMSASPAASASLVGPYGAATTAFSAHLSSSSDLPSHIFHTLVSALGESLTPERLDSHTAAVLRRVQSRAETLAAAATPPSSKSAKGLAGSAQPYQSRLAQQALSDARLAHAHLATLSSSERAQHPAWPRLVTWSLLDECWATCSSNTPVFRPWLDVEAKSRLYAEAERLSGPERCAVLAMCALAVRSTMDLDVLGMSGLDSAVDEAQAVGGSSDESLDGTSSAAASSTSPKRCLAVQRELFARALRTLMMETYDRLEVAHGEGDEEALKATLVCGALMMWNELLPRRSRSLVRTALGHYRDLFDATSTLHSPGDVGTARKHLLSMYALPLLHQDATTAAYLRAAPLITDADLDAYFPAFPIPTLSRDGVLGIGGKDWNLREQMLPWFDVDRLGGDKHDDLLMGSMVIYTWVAACLRWCAEMSCARSFSAPLSAHAVNTLFSLVSQVHLAIQALQHHFVHSPAPLHPTCVGPGGDTCEHLHLRWCSRLDRETDDCVWLAFATVGERMMREESERDAVAGEAGGEGGDEDRVDVEWLQRCEGQVRQGLKRAAFYFNAYTLSPDPHQTHHLAFELELIPSWTFLAAMRFTPSASGAASPPGASGGPRKKADELTETELDWIERGLEVASLYHSVAERRLVELRAHREAERRSVARLVDAGMASACSPSAGAL
ncbi:hypothetical protein DMC30DRAFT_394148 [Rhodotorula diobovata]|uniref:Zn(2)-C6 fungal-type domain-containing protein n=1 Tax=Rhodotorula diobovata TaxID=5288 RepID=A0A5C5FY26_9BASI|nr:hypothetical protein DMC30DRAFT_394148 [Rhodotorula diobovata]